MFQFEMCLYFFLNYETPAMLQLSGSDCHSRGKPPPDFVFSYAIYFHYYGTLVSHPVYVLLL